MAWTGPGVGNLGAGLRLLSTVGAPGAALFARIWGERLARRHRVEPRTVATAINIGNPASYDRAVRAIRETDGVVTAVSDDEILEAKAVVDAAGVRCGPGSGARVGRLQPMVRRRPRRATEPGAAVLTRH